MGRVRKSIEVVVPPAQVWEAYTDFGGWLEWNHHLRLVEVKGELALGGEARVALRFAPVSRWVVTELTPGRSFTWRSSERGVTIDFGHEVAPRDGGSEAILWAEVGGPLGRLGSPLATRIIGRNIAWALRRLKARLEKA